MPRCGSTSSPSSSRRGRSTAASASSRPIRCRSIRCRAPTSSGSSSSFPAAVARQLPDVAHGLEVGYDVRVREQSSATLASARRRELALSADHEARERLLNLAKENEPQAFAPTLFADALFRQDSAETFREGYVFRPGPDMKAARHDLSDWG